MTTNFERIKAMNLEELAKELTEQQCRRCMFSADWLDCWCIDCWCHRSNGYQVFKQWLQAESEEECPK